MSKRSKAILVAVLAAVLVLAVAVPVFAATNGPGATTLGTGYRGYGHGPMLGAGLRGIDTAAQVLGMDAADLATQRHDGQSLAQIAQSKGMSTDTLIAELLKARKTALDAAVAAGTITQAQADYMMHNMSDNMADRVNDTDAGPGAGAGAFRGQGMRGGCGLAWQ
jgi:hypothetical protein